MSNTITPTVFYRTLNVEGLEIFYREAGPRDAPTVLLLHGFPSSSHMFRNLIPMLADKYHVVAPDFPGYGESSAPSVNDFDYSYERLATVTEKFTEKLNLSSYALYLSDIGSSVGFRLAVMHPERVTAMIVQNGDAHVEAINKEFAKGLFDYWEDRTEKNAQVLLDWLLTIEGTKWHYLHGVSDPSKISPDNWVIDQAYEDRPGNKEIQLSILIFNGASLGDACTVALGGKVHIDTELAAGTRVPMGWIAFGRPGRIYPPEQAPSVHEALGQLDFMRYVFGVASEGKTRSRVMDEAMGKYTRALGAHGDDKILNGG